jgi:hypothetical protein
VFEEQEKPEEEAGKEQDVQEEPQVYNAEKDVGGWKFSRRGFLTAAATAATGAAAAAVIASGHPKKVSAQPIEIVSESAQPAEAGLKPGQPFTKIWHFRNNTETGWGGGAKLRLTGGEAMQVPELVSLPDAAPGEIVAVSVDMVAPADLGEYQLEANFEVEAAEVTIFMPVVFRSIPTPTFTPTPTPTHTPTPSATPCSCHGVCSCDGYICTCDSVCTCDTVHYWYPN